MTRTRTQKIQDRRDLNSADNNDQVIELCRTIDDMGERVADALEPLRSIVDLLNAIDERLRRR